MSLATQTTIRLATLDDIPTICHHRHNMFVDMGSVPDDELAAHDEGFVQWLQKMLESGEYLGFLAQNEAEEVIGGAGLWLQGWPPYPLNPTTKRGYILNVFVEREYRRMGIAKQLVVAIIDYCKVNNRHLLMLHASDEGRPLYESLGFTSTNEMRLEL